VSDLVAVETVGTEFEADIVCGVLRDARIQCTHRATPMGAASLDGMPGGGPRAVLVRPEDVAQAREVLSARPER
jgi:hypothetical protein